MIKIKLNGVTRIVFLVGNYAIKIPNFLYSHQHFLQGCYANWSERTYCKQMKGIEELSIKVTPTIFCFLFGLLSIQKRCNPLERDLTEAEVEYFKHQTTDVKKENFGILNGVVVCIDYV